MAEIFDFAKGKAALEAKKNKQISDDSTMPPLSSKDISELFSLTEEEAAQLLKENLSDVFNKIMAHAKSVDNFTEEEAHKILNKHFEDLFTQVFIRASQDGHTKEELLDKLNHMVSRSPSLHLVKRPPDSEK